MNAFVHGVGAWNQAATATASKNIITLKGSVAIVTEFFSYSINRSVVFCSAHVCSKSLCTMCAHASSLGLSSILYQRGIYPPESFATANQYGLSMMVSTDEGLKKYLMQVLAQLSCMLPRIVRRGCARLTIRMMHGATRFQLG